MPFKSKAQQRFMFATHPRMAKRWADETPNMKKLPEKVKKAEADKIEGGLADHLKSSDFPKKKLKAGQKVEKEHTKDPSIAKEIAKDHLVEDSNYYEKLKKVEKTAFAKMAAGLKKKMTRKYC